MMHEKSHLAVRPVLSLALAALILVACLSLTAGCGGNSPDASLQKFFDSWQANNWEAHKKSVAPGQKLTKEQDASAKQKFEQIKVKFEGLKMKVAVNAKDKNRATVTVTDGKITYTVDVLGEKKTETQDISKMDPTKKPAFEAVKVNGTWYVDTPLG